MKKKNFEVVISPTDVLGEEMKDVLGGLNKATTTCTKAKGHTVTVTIKESLTS